MDVQDCRLLLDLYCGMIVGALQGRVFRLVGIAVDFRAGYGLD